MTRVNIKKLEIQLSNERWSKEQDIFLIEYNHLDLEQLSEALSFDADEIMQRRKILGLITRNKQLKKFSI